MICNGCGGSFKVIDNVGTDKNIMLRKKKCKDCGLIIFTEEKIIPYDANLRLRWGIWHRKNKK